MKRTMHQSTKSNIARNNNDDDNDDNDNEGINVVNQNTSTAAATSLHELTNADQQLAVELARKEQEQRDNADREAIAKAVSISHFN